jgi:glutamate carboxypeptidase
MIDDIIALASISSHSIDVEGLKKTEEHLVKIFSPLEGKIESIRLPDWKHLNKQGQWESFAQGNLFKIRQRPEAKVQLLIVGHYDTVYAKLFPIKVEGDRLFGPGVADMKGGIILFLHLLRWLENSHLKEQIGWEVMISPDEEIGSCGSRSHIEKAAVGKTIGLVFEPSMPSGSIVGKRPGSFTFVIEAKGKGGHAGRGAREGKNALVALAEVAVKLAELQDLDRGVIVNPAWILGGEAANMIPEKAVLVVNVRTATEKVNFQFILDDVSGKRGVSFNIIQEEGWRPPRNLLPKTQEYIELLGIRPEPSFGVSDSNILEAVGLPTLDGLGPTGFNLHTQDESLLISSLAPRFEKLKSFLSSLAYIS